MEAKNAHDGCLGNYYTMAGAYIDCCEWPHDSNLTINILLHILLWVRTMVQNVSFTKETKRGHCLSLKWFLKWALLCYMARFLLSKSDFVKYLFPPTSSIFRRAGVIFPSDTCFCYSRHTATEIQLFLTYLNKTCTYILDFLVKISKNKF